MRVTREVAKALAPWREWGHHDIIKVDFCAADLRRKRGGGDGS